MSSRHIRRMTALKENKQDENEEQDDTPDDEPYAQQSQTFQGLEISSGSESENEALSDPSPSKSPIPGPSRLQRQPANIPEEDKYGAKKKTYTQAELAKKEKMALKKAKRNKQKNAPKWDEDLTWLGSQINDRMSILPNRVQETGDIVDKKEQRKNKLFFINPYHLDVNTELAKVYGNKNKKSPSPLNRKLSQWIGLSPEIQPIKIKGISMTRYKTEEHVKYFRFTHTQDYRTRCYSLIKKVKARLDGSQFDETQLYCMTCLEACIENCDILYSLEEHSEGRLSLEQCLFCMQFVMDPLFSYTDGNTRLLYDYVENRPFLIALLKYIYMLSNTACYITALALGKVLLTLDRTDPLCMLFIIDTLAIRARQFDWLLSLIEAWRDTRNANRFFNMRYSRALALFHIERRNNRGEESNAALFKAIISYPSVIMKIIDLAKIPVPDDIKNHELFNPPANYPVPSRVFQQVMNLYAWFIAPTWREPFISEWVIKVLRDTITQYDESCDLRKKVLENATLVAQVYRCLPAELNRHLYTIRSMSSYMGGGYMPPLQPTVAFNPYPTRGYALDTYDYFNGRHRDELPQGIPFFGILDTISPNYGALGSGRVAVPLANRNGSAELIFNERHYIFWINYDMEDQYPGLPLPPEPIFEAEDVDILYRSFVVEDDYYFTAVFLTEDEIVIPLLTTKIIVLQLAGGIQIFYYILAGEFIRDRRNAHAREYNGYIEPPLDEE